MKYNYFLMSIIAVCIYVSYANIQKSNAGSANVEFAALVNDYINKTQNSDPGGEKSLAERETNSLTSGNGSRQQTRILGDNSKLNTMYDGFGNKTEARCFNNHPRLTCIVMSSAVNGQRRAMVYGQSGDIKELPEDMLDKATTASPDEIANMAGIYAVRQQTTQSAYAQVTPVPTPSSTLRTTENNQYSNQNLSSELSENKSADSTKSATPGSEVKTSPSGENPKSRENENSPVIKPQSDEK